MCGEMRRSRSLTNPHDRCIFAAISRSSPPPRAVTKTHHHGTFVQVAGRWARLRSSHENAQNLVVERCGGILKHCARRCNRVRLNGCTGFGNRPHQITRQGHTHAFSPGVPQKLAQQAAMHTAPSSSYFETKGEAGRCCAALRGV